MDVGTLARYFGGGHQKAARFVLQANLQSQLGGVYDRLPEDDEREGVTHHATCALNEPFIRRHNSPCIPSCYISHDIMPYFHWFAPWCCMNKIEFNSVLSEIGPVAAKAYTQEMTRLLPGVTLPSLHFEVGTAAHAAQSKSWESIFHGSRYSSSKFFIAVSSNGKLGGLFSGKLLATEVKLEFVQRDVGCHSLKGFMIPAAITYSAILGLVMDRGVLSVSEPAPNIVQRYEKSMRGEVTFAYGRTGDVLKMSVPVDEVVSPSTDQ